MHFFCLFVQSILFLLIFIQKPTHTHKHIFRTNNYYYQLNRCCKAMRKKNESTIIVTHKLQTILCGLFEKERKIKQKRI